MGVAIRWARQGNVEKVRMTLCPPSPDRDPDAAREQEEERQREWQRMQAASQQRPAPPSESEDVPGPGDAVLKGGKVAREVKEAKERDANETRAKGTCGFKKGFFDAPKPKKATKKA